ncbi:MAG: VanZ family protein [Gemmatimonadetes bacterium]|nr:VanZ family protein [Gemmatimonadota bacterium]
MTLISRPPARLATPSGSLPIVPSPEGGSPRSVPPQSLSQLGLAVLGYLFAVTLIITLLPFQFSRPLAWRVLFTGSALDVTANILLFVPLGFLYRIASANHRRHTAFRVLWFGALVSTAIEVAQLFEVERYSSVADIGANALGAWIGAALSDLTLRRLAGESGLVGRLSLELPLMGLIYLMVPLLWLNALASGNDTEHAALTLLVGVAGALVAGGLQRHHFGPDRGVAPRTTALFAGIWYIAGSFPLLARHAWLVAVGIFVTISATYVRGRLDSGRVDGRERRYEVHVLLSCAPMFLLYAVLLGAGPLIDGTAPWRLGIGFPGVASEWTRIEILRLLELVAAFTLGGYAVAEHRGRVLQQFRRGGLRLVVISTSGALLVEVIRGFHAGHGASLARGILVSLAGVYGGWLYYLQRRQVLFLLGETRGESA